MDELREKCGVFGVYGPGSNVSQVTYDGLLGLQHRGQEASGMAVSDGEAISHFTGEGLVLSVYNEWVIRGMRGDIAVGHNRYSTSKGGGLHHAQPVLVKGEFALAHNGNLPSVVALEDFLRQKGQDIIGQSDSELMAYAIQWYKDFGMSYEQAIINAYPLFTGAFSVVAMTKTQLFAFRDQCGIRPLVMGSLNGATVFASETCALNVIGAKFVREINPGELVTVDAKGVRSFQVMPSNPKLDIFEFVYFARPDSVMYGKVVEDVRYNCGRILAQECPVEADVVVPVPLTATHAAAAYGWTLRIPTREGFIKNRYVHRTFIQPDQNARRLGVKRKLVALPHIVNDKRVVLIDDSIVRGTTSKELVQLVRNAGAREIHMLVCSPPIMYPDYYGIDTPNKEHLIAANMSVEQVRNYIGTTSLHYLSLNGLMEATGLPEGMFSTSCFTGVYPIDLHERAESVRA